MSGTTLSQKCKFERGTDILLLDAGVPVVPGYHGANQDPDFLSQQAVEIGRYAFLKKLSDPHMIPQVTPCSLRLYMVAEARACASSILQMSFTRLFNPPAEKL